MSDEFKRELQEIGRRLKARREASWSCTTSLRSGSTTLAKDRDSFPTLRLVWVKRGPSAMSAECLLCLGGFNRSTQHLH
jgi:hypothetical protein